MIITVTQMIIHYAQNQMNKIGLNRASKYSNDSIHPINVVNLEFEFYNIVHKLSLVSNMYYMLQR